jgi:hypothetical protein
MAWTTSRAMYLLMSQDLISKYVVVEADHLAVQRQSLTRSTKATSHSVLGAISTVGVVNMKLRESGNVNRRK